MDKPDKSQSQNLRASASPREILRRATGRTRRRGERGGELMDKPDESQSQNFRASASPRELLRGATVARGGAENAEEN
jgi:hypothetical protein